MLLPAGILADRYDRRALMLAGERHRRASSTAAWLWPAGSAPSPSPTSRWSPCSPGSRRASSSRRRSAPSAPSSATRTCRRRTARTRPASTSRRCSAARSAASLYAVRAWAPFLVDALSYAVSCFTLSRLRTDLRPKPREGAPVSPLEQVKEGFRFVWHQPFFRTLLVWSGMSNLLVNACFFVVTMRLIREGYPPAQIGLVSTARRHRRHPRRPGRAVDHRPDADRRAHRRRRLDVRAPAAAAGLVVHAARGVRRRSSSCCCSTRPATPASAPTVPR